MTNETHLTLYRRIHRATKPTCQLQKLGNCIKVGTIQALGVQAQMSLVAHDSRNSFQKQNAVLFGIPIVSKIGTGIKFLDQPNKNAGHQRKVGLSETVHRKSLRISQNAECFDQLCARESEKENRKGKIPRSSLNDIIFFQTKTTRNNLFRRIQHSHLWDFCVDGEEWEKSDLIKISASFWV